MVNPIDFGGHRSKVKVMMGIIYKSGVRGDATLCVVIFYKYFSREATGKFPIIQDTRANLCRFIQVNYLASIMYFYVLFSVHFVKAWNTHTHSVYTP